MQRHRHQEFIRFLNAVERQVPAGKVIHVVLDNYAAHKHPNVRKWLARHPRWTFHFTPTSCSWLNAVEGFFARLTRRRLKRGVFPSLVALQEAINRFIDHHNQEPIPFVWKADPKDIIAAAKRGHQILYITIHHRVESTCLTREHPARRPRRGGHSTSARKRDPCEAWVGFGCRLSAEPEAKR
jgi:transposase